MSSSGAEEISHVNLWDLEMWELEEKKKGGSFWRSGMSIDLFFW